MEQTQHMSHYRMIVSLYNDLITDDLLSNQNRLLYHYTDTNVLHSLLEHVSFWASNILYMNDVEEYYRGLEMLRNEFNHRKSLNKMVDIIENMQANSVNDTDKIFSISFSEEEDSLHQWITYAKESGVCLELDFKDCTDGHKWAFIINDRDDVINKIGKSGDDDYEMKKILSLNIKDVLHRVVYYDSEKKYDKRIQLSKIKQRMNEFSLKIDRHQIRFKELFRLLAAYIKNKSFAIEREVRAVFLAVDRNNYNKSPQIKYFHKENGILRPYLEIATCCEHDGKAQKPQLPLKGIIVGPSGIQDTIFNSVIHRLRYGYANVYDYSLAEIGSNFKRYVTKALERWQSKTNSFISMDDVKEIAAKLWEQIGFNDSAAVCPQFINEDAALANIKLCDMNKDTHIEIIDYITKNNFFCKNGVWIRKSEVPYLYS